jgi:hypothetical protein
MVCAQRTEAFALWPALPSSHTPEYVDAIQITRIAPAHSRFVHGIGPRRWSRRAATSGAVEAALSWQLAMPNGPDAGAEQPAGAHMVAIERASSPVRLAAAAPTFRDTTAAIYPAKPSREEPRAAANRPVSAAFCDVPDPRYARVESMQSQIALAHADSASVSDLDGRQGGGSPKVGTSLRVPTAEDLKQPRRRVAARSRSSRASQDGGDAGGGNDEWDRQSARSERSYHSSAGSVRSMSSYAPSQVSNASTASTILRARVAELERENAALKDSRGDHGVWKPDEPVASGIARRGDMFRSDTGAFVHEGQVAPQPRTTHEEAHGAFPDTPHEVFEAKINAKFQATEKQLKNRHLHSSITLAHDDGGGGGGEGHSPRRRAAASRSKANPKWEGGTPPHRTGADVQPPSHVAGAASDVLGMEKLGIERPGSSGVGQRRALDNASQFTIGAVTGNGALDIYTPGAVQPVATKKAVESQPALLASGPRWVSTLRSDAAADPSAADAFQMSRAAGRGR